MAHLEALGSRVQGALTKEDPEDVHQLRVASRRLRADLPIFKRCLPKEDLEQWKVSLKSLTTSLGLARDADVQILFLEDLLSSEAGRSMERGIRSLLDERRAHRSSLKQGVTEALGALSASGALEGLREACSQNLSIGTVKGAHYRSVTLRLTARRSIGKRLEGLLACEACVRREDAASEHHRMRIAVKKLRYTLEIFAPLFRGRSRAAIGALKRLQDLLGEMHDCDVWSELVPMFKVSLCTQEGLEDQIVADLNSFSSFITARRHTLYTELVRFWFGRNMRSVLRTLNARFKDALYLPLLSFNRIGVVSDVHGNPEALRAVMSDPKVKGVKLWVSAGDIVGLGPCPEEIVVKFREREVLSIAGNYDREVLSTDAGKWKGLKDPGKLSKRFTKSVLSKASIKYLRSLGKEMVLMIGDKRFLIVHGSPASDEEKLDPDIDPELVRSYLEGSSADVLISGHSHTPVKKEIDGRTYLNPGSVGRPGDGDPRASFALITVEPFDIELVRVPYDMAATAEAVRKQGLPELFAQQFIAGRSIDRLNDEASRFREMGALSRFELVREASQRYLGPDRHTESVLDLSFSLFDKLLPIHSLGEEDRLLLACCALLHDIGWSRPGPGHHQRSMDMVLNDMSLPFSSDEKAIVANTVRYHNSLPKKDHYGFQALLPMDRMRVLKLSALLRVADALDASHGSIVKHMEVMSGPSLIVIRCRSSGDSSEEVLGLSKKKDLFERVFKRKLKVEWVPQVGC
jgi:putative phosphoesterase